MQEYVDAAPDGGCVTLSTFLVGFFPNTGTRLPYPPVNHFPKEPFIRRRRSDKPDKFRCNLAFIFRLVQEVYQDRIRIRGVELDDRPKVPRRLAHSAAISQLCAVTFGAGGLSSPDPLNIGPDQVTHLLLMT